MKHIQRHSTLMRDEVTLQKIRDEHDATQKAFEHYEAEACFRLRRDFDSNLTRISPRMYYSRLSRLRSTTCEGTGEWLSKDGILVDWMDMTNSSTKVVWLQGIPGSGKVGRLDACCIVC